MTETSNIIPATNRAAAASKLTPEFESFLSAEMFAAERASCQAAQGRDEG